ncbi:regulatory protein RecX [Corynebacterium sp. CCUG 69979]|uniref:regulatory protein RecX n=1 Tax=Corynebacterium sp. CCUG 69979 TaxID=2823890 RepID=UPI00210CCB9C|nr:regulatory protein RecX [Corynebacterium sp. CCUG 69979]
MPDYPAPDPEKLRKLQEALDEYAAGQHAPLIDEAHEKETSRIREKALRLLDQRSRSRHELRERLVGTGPEPQFEPDLIDEVLDALESSGLIDDASFAHEWVRQRATARGKSARALDLELRNKGVAEPVRAEALAQITAEDEEAQARVVAEKKVREVKVPPEDRAEYDKVLRRVVGVLARRGYNSELTMRVARETLDARIAEVG